MGQVGSISKSIERGKGARNNLETLSLPETANASTDSDGSSSADVISTTCNGLAASLALPDTDG